MDSEKSENETGIPKTSLLLCFFTYDSDLEKEYIVISAEVLPKLLVWCWSRKVKLFVTHFKLGKEIAEDEAFVEVKRLLDVSRSSNNLLFLVHIMGREPATGTFCTTDKMADFESVCNKSSSSTSLFFHIYRNLCCESCLDQRDNSSEILCKETSQNILFLPCSSCICRNCEEQIRTDNDDDRSTVLFRESVWKFLKGHMTTKLMLIGQSTKSGDDSSDQLRRLDVMHTSLVLPETSLVHQREEVIDRIESFIDDVNTRTPLLLIGEPGCGKTSIMAAAVFRSISRQLKESESLQDGRPSNGRVFYHFSGLVHRAAELEVLLRRLISELKLVESSMPAIDVYTAVQLCNSALSNPTCPPITIFIDAVDLIDDVDDGHKLKWIPSSLAPRVRLILSVSLGSPQHATLISRRNRPVEVYIPSLTTKSRKEVVDSFFRKGTSRTLTSDLERLCAKTAASSSLWLHTSCHLIRLLSSNRSDIIRSKIENLSNDLTELWEELLICLDRLSCRDLLISVLCLLTSSASGLRKSELNDLLSIQPLMPPSPFDEKGDVEILEKDMNHLLLESPHLPSVQWEEIYQALRPCLVRLSDGVDDRFYIRHDTLKSAIRMRYFSFSERDVISNEKSSESQDVLSFWNQKLANYFHQSQDCDRKCEEYFYHACQLGDTNGLVECLTLWPVFERLYTEEYNTFLLFYWKKAGGTDDMINHYKTKLAELEAESGDYQLMALRHEQVSRLFLLAGRYSEALELAKVALKWEEKDLGCRTERMVEIYGLLTDIYDEKLKLQDFISRSQLPDLRKTISYGRKSIELRHLLPGSYHKFKLGFSLMKLAFSLESWAGCDGDEALASTTALAEGQRHTDKAIEIFQELNDKGHYAEALMTKGVLSPRGTPEQLRYYHEALDICQEVNGENHILTSRIYINIGIVYEDNKDYVKAYKYFARWARVNEVVLGPAHPKTMRASRVLKEPRYLYVASRLKDLERQDVDDADKDNVLSEEVINQKAQHLVEAAGQGRRDDGGGNSDDEARDDDDEEARDVEEPDTLDMMRPVRGTLFNLASELRRTIEEMLQHALRESDDDELRTTLSDNRVVDSLDVVGFVSNNYDVVGNDNNDDDDNTDDDDDDDSNS